MAALAAAIAATAITTIYKAVQGNQDRQQAKGAANAAKDQADKLAADSAAISKTANDTSTANALRDAAKQRQQAIIGSSMGRGSTLLTGGLGVTQPAQGAGKTLLGQ